jgi:hypothetical protein
MMKFLSKGGVGGGRGGRSNLSYPPTPILRARGGNWYCLLISIACAKNYPPTPLYPPIPLDQDCISVLYPIRSSLLKVLWIIINKGGVEGGRVGKNYKNQDFTSYPPWALRGGNLWRGGVTA